MGSLWNVLRLFCIYFILSIQYFFYDASPLHGRFVRIATTEVEGKLPFIASLNNKVVLHKCKTAKYRFATELAHFCGGSLITTYHVLTAAHCFASYGNRFDKVVVKLGSIHLRTENHVHEVSWWRTYSQHNKTQLLSKNGTDITDEVYDIAIMRLKTPVSSDFPLPTLSYISNEKLYRKIVVIGGWGRIEENKKPQVMRIGRTTTEGPNCDIDDYDGIVKDYSETFFCSDPSLAHTDKGDSGSPVLYDEENLKYPTNIIGVTSSITGKYNVHMSLHFFRSFIELAIQL